MEFASSRKKGFSLEIDPLNNRLRMALSSFKRTNCFSVCALTLAANFKSALRVY